jgi:HipA-like kinase
VIEHVRALRYVTPLREGGSLPGIVEADDLGTYVVKFRGAGQGLKVLVAEVIVGELARRLGLQVPTLCGVYVGSAIARYEADEEVQNLLTASVGLNLGIDFLPRAFGFDANTTITTQTAASILWLDAFVANVDRSWRNPNLLVWHRAVWCIDHGAALYFHHNWSSGIGDPRRFAAQRYDASDHVLWGHRGGIPEADARLGGQITRDLLVDVLDQVPDEWIEPAPGAETVSGVRAAYVDHLLARGSEPRTWLPAKAAA